MPPGCTITRGFLEQRPDGGVCEESKEDCQKDQSFAVLRQLVNLRKHIMHKIIPLCGLAFFGLILIAMPSAAVAAEKFECPFPVGPNTSAKLQEIKRLLPDGNAMADPERLNATVGTLRRDGMPKSLIIDYLAGAYCPMVAQESSLTEAGKVRAPSAFYRSDHTTGPQPREWPRHYHQCAAYTRCRRHAQRDRSAYLAACDVPHPATRISWFVPGCRLGQRPLSC